MDDRDELCPGNCGERPRRGCGYVDGREPGTAAEGQAVTGPCICAQHGDLECPKHPDCVCGCHAHAHWWEEPKDCIAGRFGCGCRKYRPRKR